MFNNKFIFILNLVIISVMIITFNDILANENKESIVTNDIVEILLSLSSERAKELLKIGVKCKEGKDIKCRVTIDQLSILKKKGYEFKELRKGITITQSSPIISQSSIYGSNNSDVNIPDNNGWVYSPITITSAPSGAIVTGIDVTISIMHPVASDLIVDLSDDNLTYEYNLWNHESGTNIYKSVSGIVTFNGELVNQKWNLWAKDDYEYDAGYIDYWTVTIWYQTIPSDLVIQSLTVNNNSPIVGQSITVTVVIKNQGSGDATASFYTDFYKNLSSSPTSYQSGDYYWSRPSLSAGQTATLTYTVASNIPETWNMYGQVDTYENITESNENNNIYGPVKVTWYGFQSAIVAQPWSGWWWPTNNDNNPNLYDIGECLEKYDQYQSASSQAWELTYHSSSESWTGHCDGLSVASYMEPEPVQNQNVGGINWDVGNQKGLLTECGEYSIVLTSTTHYTCDIYPSNFWNALYQEAFGARTGIGHPVVVNLSSVYGQSWNYPVYRYEISYTKLPPPSEEYDCTCIIYYIAHSLNPDGTGAIISNKTYNFTAKLSSTGEPEPNTGAWISTSYPQNAWYASEMLQGNPDLDCDVVKNIIRGIPTSVTLNYFKVSYSSGWCVIFNTWEVGESSRVSGFNLYRSDIFEGPYYKLNTNLMPNNTKSFMDRLTSYNYTFYHKLEIIENNGTSSFYLPTHGNNPVTTNCSYLSTPTKPQTPYSLTVSDVLNDQGGSLSIKWNVNISSTGKCDIYRSKDNYSFEYLSSVPYSSNNSYAYTDNTAITGYLRFVK